MHEQQNLGNSFDVFARRSPQAIEQILIKVAEYGREKLGEHLKQHLSPQEQRVQSEIDLVEFKGGMWYRPWHNQFVPTVGLANIIAEKLPRDLIFVAQIHDVGYSYAKVAATSAAGMQWDGLDLRKDHMKIGADFLNVNLPTWTEGQISANRISKLADIVAHHDDPYIGLKLPDDTEHKIFRDWDRTFVPSTLNWFKDLLGYSVDPSFSAKAKESGITLNLSGMMQLRLASFFGSEMELPPNWDKANHPLNTKLAAFAPGGVEKQRTDFGQKVVHSLFAERLKDVTTYRACKTLSAFEDLLRQSVDREIDLLQKLLKAAQSAAV